MHPGIGYMTASNKPVDFHSDELFSRNFSGLEACPQEERYFIEVRTTGYTNLFLNVTTGEWYATMLNRFWWVFIATIITIQIPVMIVQTTTTFQLKNKISSVRHWETLLWKQNLLPRKQKCFLNKFEKFCC